MKIAIVKPDYRSAGGFEYVLDRLAGGLRGRGHAVDLVYVEATGSPLSHLGVSVDPLHLEISRDFFHHLNLVAQFEKLDLSAYDVVLCTQPGSWAVSHPRKAVLFYHHTRTFYDLFEALETVRGHDIDLHHLAAFIVRDVDSHFLTPGLPILAGSQRVKQRLADHNGLVDNVDVFSAGIDEAFLSYDGPLTYDAALCVGRHEFAKRTELFLHAMNHVRAIAGRVIGEGSFTGRLTAVDGWLRHQHAHPPAGVAATRSGCHLDDDDLWRVTTLHTPLADLRAAAAAADRDNRASRVTFLGRVSKSALIREYSSARCVVCPAFDEDYGLTCLEAMAFGKPVIACRDGGGYVELIEDGADGFLVDATGPAIAAAIDRLEDVGLAKEMGARGRAKAAAYTWPRAIDQVERALLKLGGTYTGAHGMA
jgi:glycosyltransferase involved in cell wall biosynthesis